MGFWDKDDQVRLDDTFDYIVTRVPAQEQACVMAFLRNWVGRNYTGNLGQLSGGMSTRGHAAVGDKNARAGRRALVIMRGDLLALTCPLRMSAAQIMAMPAAQVAPAVMALMPAFRVFAQQEERVNTLLQVKLNEFKASPQAFLRNNLIVTQSSGSATGVGQAENHRFIYNYAEQQFMLLPTALNKPQTVTGDGLIVKAVNVPEVYWFNVPGRGNVAAPAPGNGTFAQIRATTLAGAGLMVTSAFTGCSFCFKTAGGNVYAAHISPDGTAANAGPSIGAQPELARQLIATGNFAAPAAAQAGALSVYGRGLSNVAAHPAGYAVNALAGVPLTAASMYVFGVVKGGGWRLYFQQNNMGAKTVGRLL